jgi:hypothetical protein
MHLNPQIMSNLGDLLKALVCRFSGHTLPPLVEVWESRYGLQRSYYVCRRCLAPMGEKP